MRNTRRLKRMSRNRVKLQKMPLTSLMDVFTILVFFLLVNATSTQVLPSPKNIVLPEAAAEKLPSRNLVIAVDERVIRLQGKAIITVKDALAGDKNSIKPLFDALRLASSTVKDITDRRGVTIMGDREIPYLLLKKIMLTCAGAQYNNISFAVNQKAIDS